MPVDNPRIGETWEMTDPISGQTGQAVVINVNRVQRRISLISRQGHRSSFPEQSFIQVWRFVAAAPDEICAHGRCDAPGYLQVQDLGNWVWVCPDHLPAWITPLLPTDDPEDDSEAPRGLNQCPSCNASTRAPRPAGGQDHTYMVHRCARPECQLRWILVQGSGQDDEGVLFAEAIQEAAGLLEEDGLQARALLGHTAFAAVGRSTHMRTRLGEGHHVVGVPVSQDARWGPNAVLILGTRNRTGVQRLGGQPDQAAVHGPAEDTTTAVQGPPITITPIPEAGTVWVARDDKRVIQIDGIREREGQMQILYKTVGGQPETLPWSAELGAFLARFIQVPEGEPQPAEEPYGEVGDEFMDSQDIVVIVQELLPDAAVVHIEGNPRSRHLIKYRDLRGYTKIERRSTLERILADDD